MLNGVAIAGAYGFIGSHLSRALPDALRIPRRIDLREPLAELPCETLYICAGVTGGAGLLRDNPRALVTDNLLIHMRLFEACAKAGVKRVICLSSTTGYPESNLLLKENDFFKGDLYPGYYYPGHTRRFIERLGGMYPEMAMIFIRCPGAYGPGDDYDPATSHVIPATIRKVAERHDPLVVWGDGGDVRDGTYIDDLVEALILAGKLDGHHAINVATGTGMSVNGMIGVLTAHAGYDPEIVYDKTKPSMIRYRSLDVSKAKELLGWQSKVTMTAGLIRTMEWYESQ